MSPYSEKLLSLISKAGLRQNAFSSGIGILPNHLSQVLRGNKGPFNATIQQKINAALGLTKAECEEMARLADISNRSIRLSRTARSIDYQIAILVSERSDGVPDRYIQLARLALAAHAEYPLPR